MVINQKGLDLIKSFEGCRLKSYQDVVGVWTIGYGATGSDIGPELVWTQEQADARLAKDLGRFEQGVDGLLDVDVSINQFSALVSFAYNLGIGNLAKSHLLVKTNAEQFDAAADEFLRWGNAGGKPVPGLMRRRQAERELFLTPV